MDDAFEVQLFGSYQRKAILQVEPHLVTKAAERAGAGTILFLNAILQDMPKEIKVLLHGRNLRQDRNMPFKKNPSCVQDVHLSRIA